VHADPIQIEQVLINMMRNALEAMAHSHWRELTVTTAMRDPETVEESSVGDTGLGMAQEVAGRILEPFICRSIIDAHSGMLVSEPEPEDGSIFRFTLPAAAGEKSGAA
jgi:signal transduction histidine kinase